MAEIRADNAELKKRIYQVSRLLRRKPINVIIQSIIQTWGVTDRQAYNYIRLAKIEWQKYFDHLKYSGMGYYVSQLRDLKDKAYNSKKVVVGKGDERKVVKIPNLGLVFEITKEEAKLMGQYPAEKHDINVTNSFADWIKKTKKAKEDSRAKGKAHNEITDEVPEEGIDNGGQTNDVDENFKM